MLEEVNYFQGKVSCKLLIEINALFSKKNAMDATYFDVKYLKFKNMNVCLNKILEKLFLKKVSLKSKLNIDLLLRH